MAPWREDAVVSPTDRLDGVDTILVREDELTASFAPEKQALQGQCNAATALQRWERAADPARAGGSLARRRQV